MLYRLVTALARLLCWLMYDLRIEGLDYIPRQGPVMLVSNHRCALDWLVLMAILPRPIHFFTQARFWGSPVTRWFWTHMYCVAAGPGADSQGSMRQAEGYLRQGEVFCSFPEGRAHNEPTLLAFGNGFVKLSLTTATSIVPCVTFGSERALVEPLNPTKPWHAIPRPARIRWSFLPPMTFENPALDRELFTRQRELVRDVMGRELSSLATKERMERQARRRPGLPDLSEAEQSEHAL